LLKIQKNTEHISILPNEMKQKNQCYKDRLLEGMAY